MSRERRQRRRRAAAVGGAAYAAGKHHAEAGEAAPPPAQAPPQPEQPSPGSGASTGLSPEALEQIKQLAELHEQGALTDEEFAREKSKLLGGG